MAMARWKSNEQPVTVAARMDGVGSVLVVFRRSNDVGFSCHDARASTPCKKGLI